MKRALCVDGKRREIKKNDLRIPGRKRRPRGARAGEKQSRRRQEKGVTICSVISRTEVA